MKKAITQTSKWHTEPPRSPPRSPPDLILEDARVIRRLWTNTKRRTKKKAPPSMDHNIENGGRGGVSLLGDRSEMLEWQNIDTTFQNKNTCEVVQSFVRQQSPKPRCCIPLETHSSTVANICARSSFHPRCITSSSHVFASSPSLAHDRPANYELRRVAAVMPQAPAWLKINRAKQTGQNGICWSGFAMRTRNL